MTELLIHVWEQDPLLVISVGLIVVLLVYIEGQRLRIQMINTAFNGLGNSLRGEGGNVEGGGCLANLLALLLVVILLVAIYMVAPR